MKISVILPVYNVAPWLDESLDSALGEEGDIEVVCVDDGSTDGSGAILDERAAKSGGRMKVLHKENGGVSSARNAALKLATGDWIMFLDGDDVLARGWLSVVTNMAERYPGIPVLGFDRSIKLPLEPVSPGDVRELDVSRRLPIDSINRSMCQFAYRRDILDGIEFRTFVRGEDKIFQCETMIRASRIALSDAIIYGYRPRVGSAVCSQWTERSFSDEVKWRLLWMDVLKASGKGMTPLLRRHLGGCFIYSIPRDVFCIEDARLRSTIYDIWFDSLGKAVSCDFPAWQRVIMKVLVATRSVVLAKVFYWLLHCAWCVNNCLMSLRSSLATFKGNACSGTGCGRIRQIEMKHAAMLADKGRCTGCAACASACRQGAICMQRDSEGFLYPHVETSRCIGCGKCKAACPVLNPVEGRRPLGVYAAMSKDDAIRMCSSSGGVFTLLAKSVIADGGAVVGAAFDRSDWHVAHVCVENDAGLDRLRGSKYVQSEIGKAFDEVVRLLEKGRKVLFSGTPCQVAGLRRMLESSGVNAMDNLLLVDIVCHAVPSPLAWERYLGKRCQDIGCAQEGLSGINSIAFRNKACGWKRYLVSLGFANGVEHCAEFSDDTFMRGFLSELYNRPACHNCQFRNLSSGADLTIGDYWGVASRYPDMDDDSGTSLVLVNSAKGARAFTAIGDQLTMRESDFAHAVESNPAIVRPFPAHKNRAMFFANADVEDFDNLVGRLLKISPYARFRSAAAQFLRKVVR